MTHQTMSPAREKRPTALKGLFFVLLLIALTTVLLALAFTRRSAEGPLVATAEPEAISVQAETVFLEDDLVLDETFAGMVTARRSSQLGFSSGGRIDNILVDLGDRVTEGQTLAKLDTRDLNAQLSAAKANILEAEANYSLARTTLQRQQTLFERDHVSLQRVDEARAQADAAAARIEATKAQADMLRVAIDLSTIRAPFAGTIVARMSDEGAIAVPGAVMLELVETGQLEARIGLPAVSAGDMQPGELYELSSDRGAIKAKLKSATGVIDQARRTVTMLFEIDPDQSIEIGSVVRLPLPRTIEERGFWVPISALTESSRGLWSVYVVEPDEGSGWVLEPRLVEIVHSEGTRVFARGTVRDGERFVSEGIARLVPGQKVRPVTAPSARRVGQKG